MLTRMMNRYLPSALGMATMATALITGTRAVNMTVLMDRNPTASR